MNSGFVSLETLSQDAASPDGVVCYGVGLCFASVCAPAALSIDEVLEAVNSRWPTGLDHGWTVSPAETFRTGQPNPCPCEQDSSRVHRLLEC